MSYQNNAEEGLSHSPVGSEEDVQVNRRNWNAVLVASGLGLTGLLAISASGLAGSALRSTALIETTTTSTGYTKQYDALTEAQLATLFESFRAKYSKQYADEEEEAKRFENFKDFLAQVDNRNSLENDDLHGITKFADLTAEEFSQTYLGFSMSEAKIQSAAARKASYKAPMKSKGKPSGDSSGVVDWYMVYTTAVKNQGYCGSCWAFSATEQVESDSIRAGILTTSDALAPQQIVSCASSKYDCYGCDGGDPVGAYEYIEATGGLESDSEYPYESYYGDSETCDSTSSDYVVTVTDYTIVNGEDAMIDYVTSTGPLSVCLDASSWASYSQGVLSVCGTEVDHCVQATGINTDEGYWIVRNSWGTDWGVDGFIYLKSGENLCDITYLPTYTSTESV